MHSSDTKKNLYNPVINYLNYLKIYKLLEKILCRYIFHQDLKQRCFNQNVYFYCYKSRLVYIS